MNYSTGYEEGKADENKEWRGGKRCVDCGEPKEPNLTTMCKDCLETQ